MALQTDTTKIEDIHSQSIEQLFSILKVHGDEAKGQALLNKITSNIRKHPQEDKYKDLNWTKLSQKFSHPQSVDAFALILESHGFDKYSDSHNEIRFKLVGQDIDALNAASSVDTDDVKIAADDPALSEIPKEFKLAQLRQLNEKKYYEQIQRQNHGIVTMRDLIWRPKLEYRTQRGCEILRLLSGSRAIQKLMKARGWEIAKLKEVQHTQHQLGYNDIGQTDHSSGCIAMVIENRTDRDIFCTFTHELAHMVVIAHNAEFYKEQTKIIQYILLHNK